MTDLIDVNYAKSYNNVKTSEDDGVITALITAATEAIEKLCDRTFASASYSQWLDGIGETYLLLPQYPITAIDRISLSQQEALKIACTKSGASRANVSVSSTTMTLKSVSSGVTTTNTITLATYPTLALLKAQIDAVSGWTATILHSDSNWASADLRPCQGLECFTPYEATLFVPGDGEGVIEYNNDRMVFLSSYVPRGNKNIFVSWTGGYSTIPEIIKVCCAKLVGELYNEGKRDNSLQSESIGSYSWSAKADDKIRTLGLRKDLMPYIKL